MRKKSVIEPVPGVKADVPFQVYLDRQKDTVDSCLDKFLPSEKVYPEIIHQAMRYSIFAGGKRLRPILAIATCEALAGQLSHILYLACALEMIHTYSLMHDDLPAMDDDDYRRGRLTAHKKFGEGVAILAGNGLLTLAFQLLAEIPNGGESAEARLTVIHRICRAIGTSRGMIAGQIVDLATQGQPFSREELEYIHSSKTGALIGASVDCAAILCGASPVQREHLSHYGVGVGLAFQVVDDILDIEGSSTELGKTSGKDQKKEKATYPSLYGIEGSRNIAVELVDKAIEEIEFLGKRGESLRNLARLIVTRRS
jgi:geranylgeranyl diphosphate synthase type II